MYLFKFFLSLIIGLNDYFKWKEGDCLQMRVSVVQYNLHTISSFKEFADQVEHYIKTAEEF